MPDPSRSEVTELLQSLRNGEDGAADRLLAAVYEELRVLAGGQMRGERPDHTLQPTALVHEAFLRLVRQDDLSFENRAHFFGIASRAMRRVLVEHARSRDRVKRSGGHRVELDAVPPITLPDALDVIAVDEALDQLAALDARAARVVEARFFGGLSVEDTAAVLGIGEATVKRDWVFARAFLQRMLHAG